MHITEIQIALLLEKKLPDDEFQKVKQHLGECAECAELLADVYMLSNTLEELPLPDMDKEILQKAEALIKNELTAEKKKSFPVGYAFAGIAVIIIAALTIFLFDSKQQPSIYRSNDKTELTIHTEPSDESVLSSADLNFKWSSVRGSIAYRFLLFEENGTPAADFLVRDTSFVLPASVILQHDSMYLWRIEVIYPDETKQRTGINTFTYSSSK